jgi:hypothetical protein
MGNQEMNKFHKGLLWSLFLLIPMFGWIVYIFKVVNTGMGSKNANRWVAIYILGVIIIAVFFYEPNEFLPIIGVFLSLAGIITLWIITVKSIGWRFFVGSIISQILLFIFAPLLLTI